MGASWRLRNRENITQSRGNASVLTQWARLADLASQARNISPFPSLPGQEREAFAPAGSCPQVVLMQSASRDWCHDLLRPLPPLGGGGNASLQKTELASSISNEPKPEGRMPVRRGFGMSLFIGKLNSPPRPWGEFFDTLV